MYSFVGIGYSNPHEVDADVVVVLGGSGVLGES